MAQEVRITNNEVNPNNRVTEWETGLPTLQDLPPLSQFLISPDLASAFSITPEPHRTMTDVDRASNNTICSLQSQGYHHPVPAKHKHKLTGFDSVYDDDNIDQQHEVVLDGDNEATNCSRKLRRVDSKDVDGLKRVRLAWTPQLHKRFVEVVSYLGVKNAVPKTVMQMMNVEGLTRENVASHLQKYRLYVKRMQGMSNEGESSSDDLIGSTNNFVPDNGNGHGVVRVPMSYQPKMVYGHGFEPHSNLMMQTDWSGNNFGSGSPFQHQAPNDFDVI